MLLSDSRTGTIQILPWYSNIMCRWRLQRSNRPNRRWDKTVEYFLHDEKVLMLIYMMKKTKVKKKSFPIEIIIPYIISSFVFCSGAGIFKKKPKYP